VPNFVTLEKNYQQIVTSAEQEGCEMFLDLSSFHSFS